MAKKKTTRKTRPKKAATKGAKKKADAVSGALKTVAKSVAASQTKKKPKPKSASKLSALDAAAKVLAASKEPMSAKQMIEVMAAKKLWTSPGGKTPHATLYSAILREINTKGKDARFKKTERGKFVANG